MQAQNWAWQTTSPSRRSQQSAEVALSRSMASLGAPWTKLTVAMQKATLQLRLPNRCRGQNANEQMTVLCERALQGSEVVMTHVVWERRHRTA
mmetsp:Transcript_79079/g.219734  ORF Transcript_79079/g.219734 Transcript_79079/m.219734 type:complete len:93 (+) Transcript_79079:2056-2334(+)